MQQLGRIVTKALLVFFILLLPNVCIAATHDQIIEIGFPFLAGAFFLILIAEKMRLVTSGKAPLFWLNVVISSGLMAVIYFDLPSSFLFIVLFFNTLSLAAFLTTAIDKTNFVDRIKPLSISFILAVVCIVSLSVLPSFSWLIGICFVILTIAHSFFVQPVMTRKRYKLLQFFWLCTMSFTYSFVVTLETPSLAIITIAVTSFIMMTVYHFDNLATIYSDVSSEGLREEDSLVYLTHDVTTQLPNQQQVMRMLGRKIKQRKKASWVFVVFKPVNFQQMNKVLGHENADLLLLQLAFVLRQKMSEKIELIDLSPFDQKENIARLQSMNFLVVIDLENSRHEAQFVIDNIIQELSDAVPNAFSFQRYSLNFKLAFGICDLSTAQGNIIQAINFAGDALLEAEKNNETVLYFNKEQQIFAEQRLSLMELLSHAIENDELKVHYQPQLAIKSKNLVGLEALMRWHHPQKGLIDADEFILLAEQSGLIYQLSKWLIEQVCKSMASLYRAEIDVPVSINFSSKDLMHSELVDFLLATTERYGVDNNKITLELKESALLAASKNGSGLIDQISQHKLKLSIDDFSGSYSMFEPIRKLKIHQLKVNCQQLNYKTPDVAEQAIVSSLFSLSEQIGVQSLAMNIESNWAVEHLMVMGAGVGQGFYFAKPMAKDELITWYERKKAIQT